MGGETGHDEPSGRTEWEDWVCVLAPMMMAPERLAALGGSWERAIYELCGAANLLCVERQRRFGEAASNEETENDERN